MQYDPRQPHHLRYVQDAPPIEPALFERAARRRAEAQQGPRLRLQHGRVRGARRRPLRDRLLQPGARRRPRARSATRTSSGWSRPPRRWRSARRSSYEAGKHGSDLGRVRHVGGRVRRRASGRWPRPAGAAVTASGLERASTATARHGRGAALHPRDRGGVPDHRSAHARAALPRPADDRGRARASSRSAQARDAPVGRSRSAPTSAPTSARRGARSPSCAARSGGSGAQERPAHRRRRHAPVLALGGPGDHRRARATTRSSTTSSRWRARTSSSACTSTSASRTARSPSRS